MVEELRNVLKFMLISLHAAQTWMFSTTGCLKVSTQRCLKRSANWKWWTSFCGLTNIVYHFTFIELTFSANLVSLFKKKAGDWWNGRFFQYRFCFIPTFYVTYFGCSFLIFLLALVKMRVCTRENCSLLNWCFVNFSCFLVRCRLCLLDWATDRPLFQS